MTPIAAFSLYCANNGRSSVLRMSLSPRRQNALLDRLAVFSASVAEVGATVTLLGTEDVADAGEKLLEAVRDPQMHDQIGKREGDLIRAMRKVLDISV